MSRLLSILTALSMTASAPAKEVSHDVPDADAAIVQVLCQQEAGITAGTAVQIDPGAFITAAHVVLNGTCYVQGIPIVVTTLDKDRDFATFTSRPVPGVYSVDCSGYKREEIYLARGYAFGQAQLWAQPIASSGWVLKHRTAFTGDVFPGMSGGPVITYEGKVIGIVNALNPTLSLPLSETVVCNGDS